MSITCLLAWVAVLICIPVILLLRVTEDQSQKCRRLRRQGWTQQRIADRLGISRTTVRRRLAMS